METLLLLTKLVLNLIRLLGKLTPGLDNKRKLLNLIRIRGCYNTSGIPSLGVDGDLMCDLEGVR
jgi:hypothetical protein